MAQLVGQLSLRQANMTTPDHLGLILQKIEDLDHKLDRHMEEEEKKIGDLLDAWNAAKGVVWFVKAFAGVIAAVAATWLFLNQNIHIGIK